MDTPQDGNGLPASLHDALSAHGPEPEQILEEFLSVRDSIELMALIRRAPIMLEDGFIESIEEWISQCEAEGEADLAEDLRERLEGLREIKQQVETREDAPPLVQALFAFLQAEDDAAATAIFEARREWLATEDAQQGLAHLEGGDPESQERIEARRHLLRRLWGSEGASDEGDEGSSPEDLTPLLMAFLNARSPEEIRAHLLDHPALLTEAVEPLLARILDYYSHDAEAQQLIRDKQALLKVCREQGVEVVFGILNTDTEMLARAEEFKQAFDYYVTLHQAANEFEGGASIATWQQVVTAGEDLLSPEYGDLPGVNFDALRANLAADYNRFGTAHDQAGEKVVALAAFERAIDLQPNFAMWHRNHASTLLDIGHLDAAATALAHARVLEPDAERLHALEERLAAARGAL